MRLTQVLPAAALTALLLSGCIYANNDFTQEEFESAMSEARDQVNSALEDLDWEALGEEIDAGMEEALADIDWARELLNGEQNTGAKQLRILRRDAAGDTELDYILFCGSLHPDSWTPLEQLPEGMAPAAEYVLAQDKTVLAGQTGPDGVDERAVLRVCEDGTVQLDVKILEGLEGLVPEGSFRRSYRIPQEDLDCLLDPAPYLAGAETVLKMELDPGYDESEPFVNELLFTVSRDVDTLRGNALLRLDGGYASVEVGENGSDRVLWSSVWNGNIQDEAFTLSLSGLEQGKEYVLRFTGSGIESASVAVSFDGSLVQILERPAR